MSKTTELKIVSPEKAIMQTAVEMAILPGVDGDLGILPGHSSLVSSLRAGEIVIYNGGKVEQRLFVSGGFATINPTSISILAEEAINLATVNKETIQNQIDHETKMLDSLNDIDKILAQTRIANGQKMVELLDKSYYN